MTVGGDGRVRTTVGAETSRPQNVTVDVTGVVRADVSWHGERGGDPGGVLVALAGATLQS